MADVINETYDPFVSIQLDRASPVPLYFQLALYLEGEIRSGRVVSGDRLDNEVSLAQRLGLSRPTVREAFRYLSEKELVVRRQGHGTYVTAEKLNRAVRLSSFYEDVAVAGRKPTTTVMKNEVIRASDHVKEQLQLPNDRLVLFLERLRFVDGEPIALMQNFIPAGLVTIGTALLEEHGLYELLRANGIYPTRAEQRISARNATSLEARLLHEPKGAALLTMERTTHDENDVVIEYAHHSYRATRYSLASSISDATRFEPK